MYRITDKSIFEVTGTKRGDNMDIKLLLNSKCLSSMKEMATLSQKLMSGAHYDLDLHNIIDFQNM